MVAILDDLEASLLHFAVIDYVEERDRFERATRQLETLYLPRGSYWRLHQWATKAARILSLVRVMRAAVFDGERLQPELLRAFEGLATKARTHSEPAALAQVLFARLAPELRQIRQLKGSPPERLYWILAEPQNLDWLGGVPHMKSLDRRRFGSGRGTPLRCSGHCTTIKGAEGAIAPHRKGGMYLPSAGLSIRPGIP